MSNFEGYSFSWTQPYNVSMNPVYQRPTAEEEMQRVEMVDRWVDAMVRFPDAEALIKNIFKY